MKLIETSKNELKVLSSDEVQTIHIIHCAETLAEIKEDSAKPYLVAEECTNFPRLHLLTDWSENEALQTIATYLSEEEGEDEPHLIAVFELTID